MDNFFTIKIQTYLSTPAAERNLAEGAKMVLQLTRNKILYDNMQRNLPKFASKIEYELQKFLKVRVADVTHQQVEELQQQVDSINKATKIDESATKAKREAQRGKRPDHDSLPDDIKQLYIDNLDIIQKMRYLHVKLEDIPVDGDACHDGDRYPFLKELVELDKKRMANWKRYDSFKQEPEA